jgi:Amt family ammonium transporter
MLIGGAGGVVCFLVTVFVKQRLLIDDSLDVFAVHGIGGMLGSLLVSLFALAALGGAGLADGMTFARQLGVQILAVAVTAAWSGVATYVLARAIGAVALLRVDAEAEFEGLDFASHGERAYEYP